MAALLTIPQAIATGESTIYLMDNDYSNGALFGSRLTKETSSVLIAYTTAALRWGYEANPANSTLRGTANYLIWLCGIFGQQARSGSGGGTVIPITPGGDVPTPKVIYGSDFANTTDWEYAPYAGKNLTVFSNGIADYLTFGTQWIYIPTGIRIIMDGFDSAQMDYFMVITIIR